MRLVGGGARPIPAYNSGGLGLAHSQAFEFIRVR
jgi:hypothetical protein